MDGLLLHDSFETYYAGKRKHREEPVAEASKIPAKPEALTGRPAKWPPPKDFRPDTPVS